MTGPVRRSPTHGVVAGACPACGTVGDEMLSDERRTRLSKFPSGALRHCPDDAGLSLDNRGWVAWPDPVTAATGQYPWAEEAVAGGAATDSKGRFERDGVTSKPPRAVGEPSDDARVGPADPVVFEVDAAALLDTYRITKRGHETYTVDRVPPASLTRR